MSTTAAVLRRAKALIDTPDKWTQGTGARTASGQSVERRNGGVCFCALVAIQHVAYDHLNTSAVESEYAFARAIDRTPSGIAIWNDAPERTHPEVMAAFDRAIAACEQDSA